MDGLTGSVDEARAHRLSPTDLMNGQGPSIEQGKMRRIIHQSWKTTELPKRFAEWQKTWQRRHPAWSYVLWTDADNLELVKRFYPSFIEVYLALPAEIFRADMVRNLYLFHFGGVYADLDMECLRPLDDLLDRPNAKDNEGTAYVGRMEARKDHLNESIPNAWMASSAPQHPLWLLPLDFIVKTAANHGKIKHPESLTGPRPLREAVLGFQQSERWKVIVLEPRCIFPYSWSSHTSKQRAVCSAMEPGLDTKACQALFEEERPYCITYWAQSWRHVNWDVLEGKKGR